MLRINAIYLSKRQSQPMTRAEGASLSLGCVSRTNVLAPTQVIGLGALSTLYHMR
jgi:hypothetical protein